MTRSRTALLAAAVALAGCRDTDPRRQDAQWLLDAATKSQAEATCRLEDFLANKPEFSALRGERFCDPRVSVTRIREVSANERVVEYDLIRTWKQPAVEQWLAALATLEARLLALPPERRLEKPAVGPPQTRFIWSDPADGQVFTLAVDGDLVSADDVTAGIAATDEWRRLEKHKDFTVAVARGGRDTAEPLDAVLQRVGSGWAVTVVARPRATPTR